MNDEKNITKEEWDAIMARRQVLHVEGNPIELHIGPNRQQRRAKQAEQRRENQRKLHEAVKRRAEFLDASRDPLAPPLIRIKKGNRKRPVEGA